MSRRFKKVRYLEVDLETREKARYVWISWNEQLEKYANRFGTVMPVELKSHTVKISEVSLAAEVCRWILHQDESFNEAWAAVLERVKTTGFLQKGYRNL